MKLSEETIRCISYFFQGKGLDRWSGWERDKNHILGELPLLRMYVDKEKDLEALGNAVERELAAYTSSTNLGEWTE